MSALKNYYSPKYYAALAQAIQSVHSTFDVEGFQKSIFDDKWEARELKERMRHSTHILHEFLPKDYPKAVQILQDTLVNWSPTGYGLQNMIFPDFVEVYGLDYWEASIPALACFTQYGSSEFGVRPFIMKDPKKMMAQMLQWADDENEHIRRLASEGCRPRLPWGQALKEFQKAPAPIWPILEKLQQDEALYVRKSVANNLNDITKDHPDQVLKVAKRWKGKHAHTDWIVKHALRTLLKRGDPEALQLFGYNIDPQVQIPSLEFSKNTLAIGDFFHFSFEMTVSNEAPAPYRMEYGIDFVKANGRTSRKVFKITENKYDSSTPISFNKKQSFANLTTRKHYRGTHKLVIIVNGKEIMGQEFELT